MLRLENDVVEIVLRSKYICAYIRELIICKERRGKMEQTTFSELFHSKFTINVFAPSKSKKKGKNSISKIKNRTSF